MIMIFCWRPAGAWLSVLLIYFNFYVQRSLIFDFRSIRITHHCKGSFGERSYNKLAISITTILLLRYEKYEIILPQSCCNLFQLFLILWKRIYDNNKDFSNHPEMCPLLLKNIPWLYCKVCNLRISTLIMTPSSWLIKGNKSEECLQHAQDQADHYLKSSEHPGPQRTSRSCILCTF